MAIDCTPAGLAEASECYCFDAVTRERVKIYEMAVAAGLQALTPSELANRAKCYCYDAKTAKEVLIYLMCQVAAAGGSVSDLIQNGHGAPSTAPSTGVGIYFDIDTDAMYYYNGTAWVQLIG